MTEADNVRNFFLDIDPIDRRFEVLVLGNRLRRVVDGITAENEQLFDAARIHFRGKLQNAVRLRRAEKLPQDQGRDDILERRIDRVGDQLHDDRLIFFFQAEDGIRDYKVTGVQTCALPI